METNEKEFFRFVPDKMLPIITKAETAAKHFSFWLMPSSDGDMRAAVVTACHEENVADELLYVLSAAYVVGYFVGNDH